MRNFFQVICLLHVGKASSEDDLDDIDDLDQIEDISEGDETASSLSLENDVLKNKTDRIKGIITSVIALYKLCIVFL